MNEEVVVFHKYHKEAKMGLELEPRGQELTLRISDQAHWEILRITPDRKVIVADDIYEAAEGFWKIVKQLAPPGWSLEKGESPPRT